jgi:hypothetical protein
MRAPMPRRYTKRARGTRRSRIGQIVRALRARFGRPRYRLIDLRGVVDCPVDAYYVTGGAPALIDVPLDRCRWMGASSFSYARSGGHPYVRTLLDYEAGVTDYARSSLKAWWHAWQPRTLAAFFGFSADDCHALLNDSPPVHDVVPWSPERAVDYLRRRGWLEDAGYRALAAEGCPPASSCGPKPDWYGEARFDHLIRVYERIKTLGYRPRTSARIPYVRQHPVGQVLLRGAHWRVVMLNGQHRAAVLSALGHATAPVIVHAGIARGAGAVRRDEAEHWPLVRAALFTLSQARTIFDAVFDGRAPAMASLRHAPDMRPSAAAETRTV